MKMISRRPIKRTITEVMSATKKRKSTPTKRSKNPASNDGVEVMHPYAHYQSFNVTGAANSGFVISANDVYDPEYAIGGGQPYYRDQYAAMWKRYFVRSCSADVRCVTDGVKDGMARYLCVWTDTTPWVSGVTNKAVKERCLARGGKIVRVMCDYVGDHGIIKLKGTTKSILKKGLDDEDVAPPTGNSPGNLWFINVVVVDDQVGMAAKPVYVECLLKYETKWFESADPGQS